jgi:hypothetical protein
MHMKNTVEEYLNVEPPIGEMSEQFVVNIRVPMRGICAPQLLLFGHRFKEESPVL